MPLLDSTVKLNSEIRRMNADVHAKGFIEFPTIPTIAEHLIEKLVLPSGNGVNHWPDPKTANAVAVQWSEAVAHAYSSPLKQAMASPDWHEATRIANEAKLADWERRNALQEEQQLKARQEFERSKIKQGAR